MLICVANLHYQGICVVFYINIRKKLVFLSYWIDYEYISINMHRHNWSTGKDFYNIARLFKIYLEVFLLNFILLNWDYRKLHMPILNTTIVKIWWIQISEFPPDGNCSWRRQMSVQKTGKNVIWSGNKEQYFHTPGAWRYVNT